MTSGKLWWLVAGSLMLAASLLALSWPYAASTFHLEAGGRALERALPNTDTLDWWYVGPRKTQDQRSLQRAITHLEQASKAPYALRLLGRAYFCQEDLTRGVEALEQFLEKRPDHRLGHLELAAAYALMDQRLQEIEYVDLVARLTGATVSAPDLNGPVRFQPEGWKSEYIYPTTFGLPPNYGDRPTLFVHAGSQVTFAVSITQPAVLHFGMGLDPRSLDWGGDGATFEVWANGKRIFLEHLTIETAREGWQERAVNLTALGDQAVDLTLATTPGPSGDITADWAGWGEPRLEAPEAADYRRQVSGRPWLTEWKKAGVTADNFISAGESARRTQNYDKAVVWFQWAALMSGKELDTFQVSQDDQLVILESFMTTNIWQHCTWCGDTSGTFKASDGVLSMRHRNSPEQRDGFAYLMLPDAPISQFSELVINLKGDLGTLLTVELVINGKRSRPISYQPVPQEWALEKIPIEGEMLNEVLISIGERESVPAPDVYQLWIDWIGLR